MASQRAIDELVERQVGLWNQQQAAREKPGACVAISHLPGAGGAELAQRVAERLGYGLFGREIVEEIARDQGAQARIVAELDEHIRSLIERYVMEVFGKRGFAETDYLRGVVRVVQTIGERGRAVLLGRGSAFILSPQQALRVLVVAPKAIRVERVAAALGIDREAAAKRLVEYEEDRRQFLRHHFHVEQMDPTHYHLSVNTGQLRPEVAAEVVVEALQRQFSKLPEEKARTA
jgi:cytidylate kinase